MILIQAIKDILARYRQLKEEHRLLKRIVSMPMDYEMLRAFINNSDREMEIKLNDGTTIRIKSKGVTDNKPATFKDKFKQQYGG